MAKSQLELELGCLCVDILSSADEAPPGEGGGGCLEVDMALKFCMN